MRTVMRYSVAGCSVVGVGAGFRRVVRFERVAVVVLDVGSERVAVVVLDVGSERVAVVVLGRCAA